MLTTLLIGVVRADLVGVDRRAGGGVLHVAAVALETGLIGVFCAFDLMLFYVFFEFTLIPLFFLIGIWGGPQRRYAAVQVLPVHARRQPGDARRDWWRSCCWLRRSNAA